MNKFIFVCVCVFSFNSIAHVHWISIDEKKEGVDIELSSGVFPFYKQKNELPNRLYFSDNSGVTHDILKKYEYKLGERSVIYKIPHLELEYGKVSSYYSEKEKRAKVDRLTNEKLPRRLVKSRVSEYLNNSNYSDSVDNDLYLGILGGFKGIKVGEEAKISAYKNNLPLKSNIKIFSPGFELYKNYSEVVTNSKGYFIFKPTKKGKYYLQLSSIQMLVPNQSLNFLYQYESLIINVE